ncbi:L-tyrosine C(3)-methyltransferase [Thalassocella blandensis]|nr:L-tyrosine C(3)-methyltransferase [Thalassocella blandensis]
MNNKNISALEAKNEAQKIAFSPVLFQVVHCLLKFGVLEKIAENKGGLSLDELKNATAVSEYGLKVLLEMALCADVVVLEEEKYQITKIAHFLLHDKMTKANFNFIQDVCYKGLFHLDACIEQGKPVGLKELGQWDTIYEGLSLLPDQAKQSWFEFDHFYSDDSFPMALEIVFRTNPQTIVDIGGNTGKWALKCCEKSTEVNVTILDLPVQLKVARENIEQAGKLAQVNFQAVNVLQQDFSVPQTDVIWLSQFLDCFSPDEIVHILAIIAKQISPATQIYIMETFWDNQRFPAASYSIAATSVYFTAMANGNSKMYGFEEMVALVQKAGLQVSHVHRDVGISHTILQCQLP